MQRLTCQFGLALFVACWGILGCRQSPIREKPLPDPLLTSKKPVEGKPHLTEAREHDNQIPPPPPMPPALLNRSTVEGSVVQALRPLNSQ